MAVDGLPAHHHRALEAAVRRQHPQSALGADGGTLRVGDKRGAWLMDGAGSMGEGGAAAR